MNERPGLQAIPAAEASARRVGAQLPSVAPEVMLLLPPVIKAADVAKLLNVRVETFYTRRETLEALNFPPKLPGINGWSRAAILRWVETNGGTHAPDEAAGPSALERRYA